MNLQFYVGAAGSGKSWKLNQDLIAWSIENPHKRYFIIVPDQFTMHTQMELVKQHPNHGILNIEVLSFGRLSHRIFEEVGASHLAVLDDTGKSLVLRKVAADIKDDLPIIGKSLHKSGYIAEVKSTISEFMQYAVTPAKLREMMDYAEKRGALSAKLKDLHRLYEAFLAYIQNRYITTEETLDFLRTSLDKSDLIRDSVVVFDGFTGFTPIQNRVIQKLMTLTEKVIVSVLMGKEEDFPPFEIKEQSLFYLTGKMVKDLLKLAQEAEVGYLPDIHVNNEVPRKFFTEDKMNSLNHEIAHLEKSLFRYPLRPYTMEIDANALASISHNHIFHAIHITEAKSIASEVREVFMKVKDLTMNHGFAYREIAIITGDMNGYAGYLEREASKYEVPIYLDQTKGILLNPFTEFIRSAIKVVMKNYQYEAVFHFLRSGFIDLPFAEIDRLENYMIGCGIKGQKKFHSPFVRRLSDWQEDECSVRLSELNQTRLKVLEALKPLEGKQKTAGDIIKSLYDFIVTGRIQQKLKVFEDYFTGQNDLVKAKEYSQIYRLVMELLDQIYHLLEDEPMSLSEFADIFDAGLLEIKVGTIPQNVDRIVVGDMERTRLSQVRALFFLGVNDGNIPAAGNRGGLISDLDREFLNESPWELSPTPRQKMYIQRLYLYMNMTKPSERLYLSYARVDSEGKSLRPSYLIDTIKKLFPAVEVQLFHGEGTLENIYGLADSLDLFVLKLRKYITEAKRHELNNECYETEKKDTKNPSIFASDFDILTVLGNAYQENGQYKEILDRLLKQAFRSYSHHPLTKAVADLLYGSFFNNSISRLEKYATCAYAHFLQYGLALRERDEYTFESVDLGIIYHGVLELFAGKLAEHSLTWFTFSDEEGERILFEAVGQYSAQYGEMILFGSARNEQMIGRIYRIMLRTIKTLRQQLKQGEFQPELFEASFSQAEYLEAANILLSPEENMSLRGQIDRVDVCETDQEVFVKVVDYKSGHKTFDLAGLYHGLQLQLVVYLNVAMEMMKQNHPDKEVIPAAVLYYHISDPMLSEEAEADADKLEEKRLSKLKMTGIVNEDEAIIKRLDRDFAGQSLVIPVARKKDGAYTSNSGVLKQADFAVLSHYVNQKIKAMGQQIKAGDIAVNPYETKDGTGCKYCQFQHVCGFDLSLPGYHTRKLPELPPGEALELMQNQLLFTASRKQ